MATSSVIARRYFDALSRRDIDAAVACWAPGASDQISVRFGELFDAFPDMRIELLDTTTQRERCVVRWHANGTFLGPGHVQDFAPNGAQISIDGCDVLEISEDQIVAGGFYMDGAEVVQQLGLLPAPRGLAAVVNTRTWVRNTMSGGEPEAIAAGVWVLRGGLPRVMNVYLIEDEGGVTVFDAGIAQMTGAIRAAGARFGGIRRVVLGHADADHRGGAAGLDAPIYCHPLERSAARSPSPYRDYWNLGLLRAWSRPLLTRLLAGWDGGALELAGNVEEGEEIAGFSVLHLPGHAPGLIGLYRAEDGLALVSDCFYTLNPETGIGNAAHVPHPAFNLDTNQARESIRRLAALGPKVVWPGHAKPVSGEDVELQLQRAASAAV
ncbi:MAG TPA: MBL fold metallo-hydrolase [Solirubrobacteraceae bacterium]|nr:MBL fold metallo-hydrolase [Solirubrobacteraceae bacterium]